MAVELSPAESRAFEGHRLAPRKSFVGRVRGERTTTKKGISIEFADYREYTSGDDLRHLDWNVLARLDTPVVRTYRDEEDLAVYLLRDGSASMAFGEPSKYVVASQLALAFGQCALAGGDAAVGVDLGSSRQTGSLRGRAGYVRLKDWASADPAGTRGLTESLQLFAKQKHRPGLAVVISDGLDPEATTALRQIAGRGHEVWMLQVLSPEDVDPDLEGDLRLVDGEGGTAVEITANRSVLDAYRANLKQHCQQLSDAVVRSGGRYAQVVAGESILDLFRGTLKRQGWVK